jgi:hypothetical protein
MFIAENAQQFKKLFVDKLKTMLSDDELGAFILVLANSRQDAFLKAELADALQKNFVALKGRYATGALEATKDDIDVFMHLLDIELDGIPLWQTKTAGEWEVVLNDMRQLRPARASSQRFKSIKQHFDETKFHFNKPFLKPEILWQGDYDGAAISVLYNKFPFSDYHLLVAISPEKNQPQLMTEENHQLISSMAVNVAKLLPGFGIGFNSLAAGASVNHFHAQGFVRQRPFPIEAGHWKHNGGNREYPLAVRHFTNSDKSWRYLKRLIEEDVAFNCVYRQESCYVIAREYQGSVSLPAWLSGAGWLDVAGVLTVSDTETFESLVAAEIEGGLVSLKRPS